MNNDPSKQRVLIVVFDALRPEFVTPELMPNLHAFAANGVRYVNSRSTFPSETRVNQSAVITGCYPARHGIVANNFLMDRGGGGKVIRTGDDMAFEAALGAMTERLFDVPTLGERLAANGKSYATVSAGTSGGGRLINHSAETSGSFRLALRRPEAAVPAGVMTKIQERLGPLPEHALPALDWNSYAVDCYLGYVEPEIAPDVMLLWLCDPDETFHFRGIGSKESLQAMRHVDSEFGRILSGQEEQIANGKLQIIALSDHGQISVRDKPLDLAARFSDAGFVTAAETAPAAGWDIVVGNAGGIWLGDPSPGLIQDVVEWLQAQTWCGALFTRDGVGGTLTHRHVGIAHRRAPDIAIVLRYDHENNDWGCKGVSAHDSIYPKGCGCHGGLSPYEMHNFLAVSGSEFKQARQIAAAAGNVDIMPTVLALLGIGITGDIDGRILDEALRDGPGPDLVRQSEETFASTNDRGPVTRLSVTTVGSTPYINQAWLE